MIGSQRIGMGELNDDHNELLSRLGALLCSVCSCFYKQPISTFICDTCYVAWVNSIRELEAVWRQLKMDDRKRFPGKTVREVCEEAAGYSLDPMAWRVWGVDPNELYDDAAARLAAKEDKNEQ